MCCPSPSKCSTASTMCSSTLGPARFPSLVMWPMSITGTEDSFAYFSSLDAHSRTCDTLPATDSRVSEAMVCMESTMTRPGWVFSMWLSIFSSDVSQTMKTLSLGRPMRSALILICFALSSPETYSMVRDLMESMFWSTRVDLPMPGSPPMRMMLPGTRPPPRTRLSSEEGILMRGSSSVAISDTGTGADRREDECGPGVRDFFSGSTFSSTMVFHSPHAGHRPTHFGDSAPQLLQNHTVLTVFIVLT